MKISTCLPHGLNVAAGMYAMMFYLFINQAPSFISATKIGLSASPSALNATGPTRPLKSLMVLRPFMIFSRSCAISPGLLGPILRCIENFNRGAGGTGGHVHPLGFLHWDGQHAAPGGDGFPGLCVNFLWLETAAFLCHPGRESDPA